MSKTNIPFFMVPMTWDEEDQVTRLTPSAQLLLLALIRFCQARRNGGRMTEAQARKVCRQVARGHAALDQILGVGILESVTSVQDHRNSSAISTELRVNINSTPVHDHHNSSASSGPGVAMELSRSCTEDELILRWVCFANPVKWLIDRPVSAGQSTDEEEPRARARVGARAAARVQGTERTEQKEERTPSGSVRSSSARAAPRNAGGVARPAPREEDQEQRAGVGVGDLDAGGDRVAEDGPTMSKSEALKAIRNSIGKSSMSSGRPAQLRKYPMELNPIGEPSLPVELNGSYE